MDIDGDGAIVGHPELHNEITGARYGRAYVYRLIDGVWQHEKTINNPGQSEADLGDAFGWSVAISGDTVVVGAPRDDEFFPNGGGVYVFERNIGGSDNWGQRGELPLIGDDSAISDEFGYSVSIDGDTVVVGAHRDSYGGLNAAGSTYVFYRDHGGSDNWGQFKKLTASDAAAGD